jgi:hypothetical protein
MVSWSDLGHNLADFRRSGIRICAVLSCRDGLQDSPPKLAASRRSRRGRVGRMSLRSQELTRVREMLDRRYYDLKGCTVPFLVLCCTSNSE